MCNVSKSAPVDWSEVDNKCHHREEHILNIYFDFYLIELGTLHGMLYSDCHRSNVSF